MPVIDQAEIDILQNEFETAHPQTVLQWAAQTFGSRLAVVTSFQPTGIVTLHMLHQLGLSVDVLTLDTGFLFKETDDLITQVEERFRHSVQRIRPPLSVVQQAEVYGPNLWARDPDRCCYLRKTAPLQQALHPYAAWITGLRRDQSPQRADTPVVSWDERYQLIKLCPYATWTEDMIWAYIEAYNLPYNTLHDQGYPSIGCFTCTQAVAPDDDPRAGRWAGRAKTECGIHVPLADGTPLQEAAHD